MVKKRRALTRVFSLFKSSKYFPFSAYFKSLNNEQIVKKKESIFDKFLSDMLSFPY